LGRPELLFRWRSLNEPFEGRCCPGWWKKTIFPVASSVLLRYRRDGVLVGKAAAGKVCSSHELLCSSLHPPQVTLMPNKHIMEFFKSERFFSCSNRSNNLTKFWT
jgi:hypothetical protein